MLFYCRFVNRWDIQIKFRSHEHGYWLEHDADLFIWYVCLVICFKALWMHYLLVFFIKCLSCLFIPLGIMWPIEAQMPFMKIVSEHLPLCYISRILNNIVLRGWTLGHPTVLTGIAIIIGYVFLHVIMLLFLTHIKKDAWLVRK